MNGMPLVPGVLLRLYLKYIKHSGWFGSYPDWESALKKSSGYDQQEILEKVLRASLDVKQGHASYERDSVAFYKPDYEWPLLTALYYVAALSQGRLSLLDFGGSLGSLYFQNSLAIAIENLQWTVVEQDHFVEAGVLHFQNEQLKFEKSIDKAINLNHPNCMLFSSVLPYLDQPYEILAEAQTNKIPYIIIYNTPFSYREDDIICIQKVNPKIYNASYPCRFLNKEKILKTLYSYEPVFELPSSITIHHDSLPVNYSGMLLKIKKND